MLRGKLLLRYVVTYFGVEVFSPIIVPKFLSQNDNEMYIFLNVRFILVLQYIISGYCFGEISSISCVFIYVHDDPLPI